MMTFVEIRSTTFYSDPERQLGLGLPAVIQNDTETKEIRPLIISVRRRIGGHKVDRGNEKCLTGLHAGR